MRIARLDLLRYGHFTDTSIDFGSTASKSDFHIIFGSNETGKSTTRIALEDFLFGIPARSKHNFLHKSSQLRIGAEVQWKGGELLAIRTKGRDHTLKDPDSNDAIDEGEVLLAEALNYASREFFIRMFSLDHQRLREGGQSILDADDDVGQAIFSASAGLTGVQSTLESWKSAADDLWAPRKSKTRAYYSALGRFDAAKKSVKDQTLRTSEWKAIQQDVNDLKEKWDQLRAQILEIEPRQRKLARIRRVKRKVLEYIEVSSELEKTGSAIDLPEDAMESFDKLQNDLRNCRSEIDIYQNQIDDRSVELEQAIYDTQVLQDRDEIRDLNDERAQVDKAKLDLPKRIQELRIEQQNLTRTASELGWNEISSEYITTKIPPRDAAASVLSLVEHDRELQRNEKQIGDLIRSTQKKLTNIEYEANSLGEAKDLTSLAAAIEFAQREIDSIGNKTPQERELKQMTREIDQERQSWDPSLRGVDVGTFQSPSLDVSRQYRDYFRKLQENGRYLDDEVLQKEHDISRTKEKINGVVKSEVIISEEELLASRAKRDGVWQVIRDDISKYPKGGETHENIDLTRLRPEVLEFESLAQSADELADQRFASAATDAQLKELELQCEKMENELARLLEKQTQSRSMLVEHLSQWKQLWGSNSIEISNPEQMFSWVESREKVLELTNRRSSAATELDLLTKRENVASQRLCEEITKLGVLDEGVASLTLREIISIARQKERELESVNLEHRKAEERLREIEIERLDCLDSQKELQQERLEWNGEWISALDRVGLSKNATPKTVSSWLGRIEELRSIAQRIEDLQANRIQPLERDTHAFQERVREKTQLAYPDLNDLDPAEVALRLEKRLRDSENTKARHSRLTNELKDLGKKLDKSESKKVNCDNTLAEMMQRAGAADLNTLRECIRRSDRARRARNKLAEIKNDLEIDGDGLSLQELIAECDSVSDLDVVVSEEAQLDEALRGLQSRVEEVSKQHTIKQIELDSFKGSDNAAQAEFEKQMALTDMKDAIERYIPLKTASMLLDNAIDRFRKEKQGPLVQRASEIFKNLTNGSFVRVEPQVTDKGPALFAYRADEEEVGLDGLSEGTADQLFLALRIAAIENHITTANSSLPLVVDDLFVNFDDERAEAGLRVLETLSTSSQVLFFTHHEHLVEIAKNAFADSIQIHSLAKSTTV